MSESFNDGDKMILDQQLKIAFIKKAIGSDIINVRDLYIDNDCNRMLTNDVLKELSGNDKIYARPLYVPREVKVNPKDQ